VNLQLDHFSDYEKKKQQIWERNFFFSSIENFYVNWHDSTREFKDFSINQNK